MVLRVFALKQAAGGGRGKGRDAPRHLGYFRSISRVFLGSMT